MAATGTVEAVDRGDHRLARTTVVSLPASEIFARLVDPHRHHELDGSGTVGQKVTGPHELKTGDTFTVAMKMYGIPYRITSTAVDVRNDRVVEWKHPAGHTWRWELEPQADGSTRVTEIWDTTQSKMRWGYRIFGIERSNTRGIENTLRNLEASIRKAT
jgi:hypothetical protein